MKSATRVFGSVILAISFAATTAVAQPAAHQLVLQVEVRQGAAQQYEDYVRKIVEAAAKLGNVQNWAAFQTTSGGPSGQYVFALSFNSWADRDGWIPPAQMLVKAFGEEEAAKLMRTGQSAVAHSETFITNLLPESTGNPGPSVYANYLVSRTKIKPELINEYRLAISKIWASEAKAGGGPARTMRRRIEGDRWLIHGIAGFENGAARDKWPSFQEHMSASYSQSEIDQILDTIRRATVSSHWFEIAHRPDLSHAPAAASND